MTRDLHLAGGPARPTRRNRQTSAPPSAVSCAAAPVLLHFAAVAPAEPPSDLPPVDESLDEPTILAFHPLDDADARLDALARELTSQEYATRPLDSRSAARLLPRVRREWAEHRRLGPIHPFRRTARIEAKLQRLVDELEAEAIRLSARLDALLVRAASPDSDDIAPPTRH